MTAIEAAPGRLKSRWQPQRSGGQHVQIQQAWQVVGKPLVK